MMIKQFLFLLAFGIYLMPTIVISQCTDAKAEKIAQLVSKKAVSKCSDNPNKLKITVTNCSFEAEQGSKGENWKIWTTASWSGKYTTLDYEIKLYIEDSGNGKYGVYFIEYSNSLVHRCIDLDNTKPLELKPGSVVYYPYKEFEYSEIEE